MRPVQFAVALLVALAGCGDSGTALGDVIGRVLAGGAPVAGVTARLTGTGITAVSGDDGGFRLDGVPRGNHTVQLERLLDGRLQIAESPLFRFAGETVDLGDLTIRDAGTGGRDVGEITGRILDDAGEPILGAGVELSDGAGLVQTTRSGTQGGYAFRNVSPGTYRVAAIFRAGDELLEGAREALVVARGLEARLLQAVDLVLADGADLGGLEGTVTDSRGDPIAGATVSVSLLTAADEPPIAVYTAVTNALGAYALTALPGTGEDAAVTAGAAGFAGVGAAVSIRGGSVIRLDFELAGQAPVAQRPPTGISGLALTYPIGGGPAARALAATRHPELAATTRAAPPETLIEVLVGYTPVNGADTVGQVLYRSPFSDRGGYVAVARSGSPSATQVADLSGALSIATDYSYRLTSVAADGRESELSEVADVRPLERLVATAPADGATDVDPATFAFEWRDVDQAAAYQVLLFDRRPGLATAPVYLSPVLNGGTLRHLYDGPALETAAEYFWSVVAFDQPTPPRATAESYGAIMRFTTGTP